MKFEIIGKTFRIKKTNLEKVAQAAFSVLGKENPDYVEMIFVSQNKIRTLNLKYRSIDRVTDVLSFTLEKQPLMGQIFICYTKASEQAILRKISLEAEVDRLLVHGMLHLYGYDHGTKEELILMTKLEEKILERLKL